MREEQTMSEQKPVGKGRGEYAEGGDDKYQNERLANIEEWIAERDPSFSVPVQTYGADAAPEEGTTPEEPGAGGTV